MTTIGQDIEYAVKLLRAGEVVGIPTETVYGLAGNAFDPSAVAKIFQVKQRPSFDPLIVHTSSLDKVEKFVSEVPEKAYKLAHEFCPGPLTMLLPKLPVIPDLVTSGLPRVAIRIPNHPLAIELLNALEFPLTAPSANPFGYISPTSAKHVHDQLKDKIPYILDGGSCKIGIESTIVGFEKDKTIIYRLGGITVDTIKKVIGEVSVNTHSASNPSAPGLLKSHYSPRKKVVLGNPNSLIDTYPHLKIGVLSFQSTFNQIPEDHQFMLSGEGNLEEAAQNLFAALRRLDNLPIDIIIAEIFPKKGLGLAINDRLKRAAAE